MTDEIKVNDIVQIVDENHKWFPCLLVVSQIKSFGIMGYTTIVNNTRDSNGEAYIRINFDQIEKVGEAHIVAKSGGTDA